MVKSSEVISFALAGYGRFGRHHANVLSNHPSAQVSAIAEPDPYAIEQARKDFPDTQIFEDPVRMIQEMEFDAVNIVSPDNTHAEIVRPALNNGIHVFCEKPPSTRPDASRA